MKALSVFCWKLRKWSIYRMILMWFVMVMVLVLCSTGFYYNPEAGWYYSSRDGLYYKFEDGNYVLLGSSSDRVQFLFLSCFFFFFFPSWSSFEGVFFLLSHLIFIWRFFLLSKTLTLSGFFLILIIIIFIILASF